MDHYRFLEALRAGVADPWAESVLWIGGKSKPSPPPDYAGAARTQGASNVQTAIAQSILDRPAEITPYGSRTWTQTGSTSVPSSDPSLNPVDVPLYTSNVDLTPLGRERFNQQERITGSLGDIAESGINRVASAFGRPFSADSSTELQNRAEEAYMARLNPQFARDEESLRQRLANQGLAPGSEAYANEMDTFNRARNDARSEAVLKAFQTRPQALQEELAIRNIPLNELNALVSSSQVTVPQFGQFGTGTIGQSPIMQGAQLAGQAEKDRYNLEQAQNNSLMGGLFSLGGAALSSPWLFAASDRRLKRNIQRIGLSPRGYPWYRWSWVWGGEGEGVIADEVPHAAIMHSSGYYVVDYSRV